MEKRDKPLSSFLIISKGFQLLKETSKSSFKLVALTIFLPQLIFFYYSSLRAQSTADLLHSLSGTVLGEKSGGYLVLVSKTLSFGFEFIGVSLLFWVLFVAGYMGLVEIALSKFRTDEELSATQAFKRGLKKTLPAGLIMSFFVSLLFSLGQSFLAPMIIPAVLAIMAPVIIAAEGAGGFSSVTMAVFFKYARGAQISFWQILFSLGGVAALLYGIIFVWGWMNQVVLTGDQFLGITRELWSMSFMGFPFSGVFSVLEISNILIMAFVTALLPPSTTFVYFVVSQKISVRV